MFNEDELIQGCCKNDRASQRQLYERYARKMLVVCLRYTKNQLEAEDILQESFIKIFDNIQKFRKECPLEQWIKRIVINTSLKNNRSKLYLYPAVDLEQLDEDLNENLTLSNYNYKELIEIIRQLPPRYQIIFNLYAIEGYQHKEIAEMLGMSEGTSKSQYCRARGLLQKIVKEHYENRDRDEPKKIVKISEMLTVSEAGAFAEKAVTKITKD
ncbi:MAG: sigma-70 family RNA polymerase sigma factor [Rickettsiaceae bacterium]|nr:sigma-70 family RNA polymerase sigma factor [Rickettsiaceae bacterium]